MSTNNLMIMRNTLHNEVEPLDVPEKLCHKCGEYWPATEEFFYRSVEGYLRSPCKACTDDHRRTVTALKPCCVPGCTNPRYYWRYARCWEHRSYLQVNPHPRKYTRRQS